MSKCTIRDVAKLAGVGVGTVSRVYNNKGNVSDELRKKVLDAGNKLGYSASSIARTLKDTKTNTIAFVSTSISRATSPNIIKGVNDVCQQRGYKVHILETDYSIKKEMELINSLVSQWVDGIILISSVSEVNDDTKKYVNSLSCLKKKDIPIPVVALLEPFPNPNVDCVVIDNEEAAFKAVYHLVEIGRKKIAYISIPKASIICKPRMNGYLKALQLSGLEAGQRVVYGDFRVIGGYRAMKSLIDSGVDMDAVFVGNDEMAIGAMRACKECNIQIPDDIAIISNDDIIMASAVEPSLSTVRLARYTLGKRGAEILLERIENGWATSDKAIVEEMKSRIIIRESTLKSAKRNLELMVDAFENRE